MAVPLPARARRRGGLTIQDVLFDPELPVLGNPNGDVTIAEFFDYQCPSCKVIHPQLKKLVDDDGQIRLVMKDWPIYDDTSRYAARMVLAAHQTGSYAKAQNAVMTIKTRLTHAATDQALRSVGADPSQVRDALDRHLPQIDALLARNEAQAKALKLPGTPGFIVSTRLFKRAMDIASLKQAVADARKGT